MTDDELKALETLADTATPGPWTPNVEADPPHPGTFYVTVPVHHHATLFLDATPYPGSEQFEWTHNACDARAKADIEFIAAARVAVPVLIAEVWRLKALDDAARAYRFGIWNVSMLCGAWGVTNVERALVVRDGMTKESAILLAQSSDERDSRRKP